MMQQDFQGRGKMMMQKPCFNTKGNMPAQPTAKTPTKQPYQQRTRNKIDKENLDAWPGFFLKIDLR